MELKLYFLEILRRIKKINLFLSNPENYKDLNNPFRISPRTYIWFDNDDTK